MQPGTPCASPAGSTKTVFPGLRFTTNQRAAAFPGRDRRLAAAFRSPVTAAPLRKPPFQGQRSRPATSPRSQLVRLPVRLFGSTARPRFAPVLAASTPQARCSLACWLDSLSARFPLPSRSFRSLGIKAFHRPGRESARLPNPPAARSLPAAVSIARSGCGSTFPGRYVSGGLLFLKPLGTSLTMPRKAGRVNRIRESRDRFPQKTSPVESTT
jgi:hypothetical protein